MMARGRRGLRGLPALGWYRRILVLLIVIGLASGVPDLIGRIRTERASNRVELVADEQSFVQLANSSGMSPTALLAQLKAAGVQGLGVSEESLASLDQQGQATMLSGAQWIDARRAAGVAGAAAQITNPAGTYVLVPAGNQALVSFIVSGLQAALGAGAVSGPQTVGADVAIGVNESPGSVANLPLGFLPSDFTLAQSLGLDVVPRPEGVPAGYSSAQVQHLFQQIASAGVPVHTVLFAGASTNQIVGYPQDLQQVASIFRAHGWNLGVLETSTQLTNVDQPGTLQLNNLLNQRSVRVYSVPPWLLQQYDQSQATISLADGVWQRNLRILYLHPITTGPDQAARTVALYAAVAQRLRADGMVLGTPVPFAPLRVHTSQRVLQSLAVVAGGLLLLELLFPGIRRYGYRLLGVLGVLVILFDLASHTLSVEVVALTGALTAGGLAMYYLADRWNRWRWPDTLPSFGSVWVRAVVAMATVAGITFLGALLVATLMGDTPHILDWQYFRGVKAVYLGIPALAALAFLAAVGLTEKRERGVWPQLQWLGAQPVNYRQVGAYLLVAVIGAVYLIRSGNVSVHYVPAIEIQMRQWLMTHLLDRPREKEFLVGYPSLLVGTLLAARRHRWAFLFFVVGASVSQVSLVDTFEHIRTPFLHSLLREIYGWLLGLCTATLSLAVAWLAFRLWDRRWVRGLSTAGDPGPGGQA